MAVLCAAMTACAAAAPAAAATYPVNSTADLPDGDPSDGACATSPPGTPVCTLRAAVMEANGHPGQDSITVPAGTYLLTRVGYDANALAGDLDVTDDLRLNASGGPVVVDANGPVSFDRAFDIHSGLFSMTGVTVKNGNTPGYGGGISAAGNLVLTNVRVQDNAAALGGGGIYSTGLLVHLTSSTLAGNTANGNGGGVSVEMDGAPSNELIIRNSQITGNQALGGSSSGGGVSSSGASVTIENSTVHGNSSTLDGGGLAYTGFYAGNSLQVSGSVFDGNAAAATNGWGGGMYLILIGMSSVTDTVVTDNSSNAGGGIYADFGILALTDVEVSHNAAVSPAAGSRPRTATSRSRVAGWRPTPLRSTAAGWFTAEITLLTSQSSTPACSVTRPRTAPGSGRQSISSCWRARSITTTAPAVAACSSPEGSPRSTTARSAATRRGAMAVASIPARPRPST